MPAWRADDDALPVAAPEEVRVGGPCTGGVGDKIVVVVMGNLFGVQTTPGACHYNLFT